MSGSALQAGPGALPSVRQFLRRALDAFGLLFYPPHCVHCGSAVPPRVYLCARCLGGARRVVPPFCRMCSQPFEGAIDQEFTCANCEHREFVLDCAVSAFRSRGVVRDLVHRFKYDRQCYLRHQLADWLEAGLSDERITAQPFEFLVPVPLHARRRREREFNQAELLARLLGRRCGVRVLDGLQRVRYTTTQTRLTRKERMENLRGAFRARKGIPVQGRHLVLIDDILTTGSTLDACARVLKHAGAASVRALTVARG